MLDTAFGKVGVAVYYDSEFPQIARRQVEQGARPDSGAQLYRYPSRL